MAKSSASGGAVASKKKLEPISEAPSRVRADSNLNRGDLTVNLADGRVAAIRPPGRDPIPFPGGPVGARYPAAAVSRSNYTVEGRVAGLVPRPDGRLRVLVVTESGESVQMIVSGEFAGQSLFPGEFVRLKGERIGGSDTHPVVEMGGIAPRVMEPMVPFGGPPMPFAPEPFPMPGMGPGMMPPPMVPIW